MNTLVNTVKHTLPENDHPYRNDAWAPMFNEHTATDMAVEGEIPTDIDGVYLRNTENPVHKSLGRYHPFDGDGMLHMMRFKNGTAEYRNRFVRTKGFEAEQEAGKSLWAGWTAHPVQSERPGECVQAGYKNASSTDVVVHNGRVLSTFWQCGDGYRLDAHTLDQLGIESWTPIDGISAHTKVDPKTGELLFFNYSTHAPYMHYGVVDKDNHLVHYIPVALPGPRMPHDMAFSEHYVVLNNFPQFWRPEMLEQGIFFPSYYGDKMRSHFAVIPRRGQPEDIKWFEADPTYVLHFLNAYEDGDWLIMDGYFQENPAPPPLKGMNDVPEKYAGLMAALDLHSLSAKLHRWKFNLKTGETQEHHIDPDTVAEFGTFNPEYAGKPYRYVYSAKAKPHWFLFEGLIKHDLQTGEKTELNFGEERYGSEAPFVPRKNATSEDDGYLVSFITDMKRDRSECVLVDAKDIAAGPVCSIILPERIPSGTHACWASGDEIVDV